MQFISNKSKLNYSPIDLINLDIDRVNNLNELRHRFKDIYPTIKFEYATLNPNFDSNLAGEIKFLGAEAQSTGALVDYILIYSGISAANNKKIIWIEAPAYFSPKSLYTMQFYKNKLKFDSFINDYIDTKNIFEYRIFTEYLKEIKNLSTNPNDSNYWKNPENKNKIIETAQELLIKFNRH